MIEQAFSYVDGITFIGLCRDCYTIALRGAVYKKQWLWDNPRLIRLNINYTLV